MTKQFLTKEEWLKMDKYSYLKEREGLNTIWLIQGLDTSEGNTGWETLIVDDTWAGALGKFNRLEHKSNWQEFRPVTAQIAR